MGGIDDEHSIVPHIVSIHGIQHSAKVLITLGKQGSILSAHMGHFLIRFLHRSVRESVPLLADIRDIINLQVFLKGEKRLMGIEALDL